MKNKYFKNRKIAYVVLVLLAIVLAISLFISTLKAYAAYSGQSSGMTRNQLHSETLATSVGNDTPAITVLMHGLGGRAMDWSNNFNGTKGSRTAFVQDLDSIIEKNAQHVDFWNKPLSG